MPITLPDSTKFDADTDRISDSRPELKKISDAVNTLAGQWNTNGDNFGVSGFQEISAGPGIAVTFPDSTGEPEIKQKLNAKSYSVTTTTGSPYNTIDLDGDFTLHQIGVTSGGSVNDIFEIDFGDIELGVQHVVYLSGNFGGFSVRPMQGASLLDSSGGATPAIQDGDSSNLRWGFKVMKVAESTDRYLIEGDGFTRIFDV